MVKNLPANAGDARDTGSITGSGGSPAGGQPTPGFLPEESHGQRNLVAYSPWGCKELNTTERAHRHMHSSIIEVFLYGNST